MVVVQMRSQWPEVRTTRDVVNHHVQPRYMDVVKIVKQSHSVLITQVASDRRSHVSCPRSDVAQMARLQHWARTVPDVVQTVSFPNMAAVRMV